MLRSTEKILQSELGQRVFHDYDLATLFGSTPAGRYGLVNKALKNGELVRLSRGTYTVAAQYLKHLHSEYYLANQIVPHSFVTAESALSFYGWTPERITVVTSLAAFGRNREFNTKYGIFIYRVTPVNPHHFFTGVHAIEWNDQSILMATPLRALIDYIYWHKVDNANFDFLKDNLRIEEDNLLKISKKNILSLQSVYHSKRVNQFLKNLIKELKND